MGFRESQAGYDFIDTKICSYINLQEARMVVKPDTTNINTTNCNSTKCRLQQDSVLLIKTSINILMIISTFLPLHGSILSKGDDINAICSQCNQQDSIDFTVQSRPCRADFLRGEEVRCQGRYEEQRSRSGSCSAGRIR